MSPWWNRAVVFFYLAFQSLIKNCSPNQANSSCYLDSGGREQGTYVHSLTKLNLKDQISLVKPTFVWADDTFVPRSLPARIRTQDQIEIVIDFATPLITLALYRWLIFNRAWWCQRQNRRRHREQGECLRHPILILFKDKKSNGPVVT